MKGGKSIQRMVAQVSILTLAVLALLMPSYAEARGGNDLTATAAEGGVTVEWEAHAGPEIARIDFYAEAVHDGTTEHFTQIVYGTGERRLSGVWTFGESLPPGTVVTIWMLVHGRAPRAKVVSTTLTV